MELGTPRRDLKGLCTLDPSHPDMQGVEKTFLNGGRGVLVHPRAKCILVTYPHL